MKAVFDTMVFLRALINPHGVNQKIIESIVALTKVIEIVLKSGVDKE